MIYKYNIPLEPYLFKWMEVEKIQVKNILGFYF
jgi:hypothetical protein